MSVNNVYNQHNTNFQFNYFPNSNYYNYYNDNRNQNFYQNSQNFFFNPSQQINTLNNNNFNAMGYNSNNSKVFVCIPVNLNCLRSRKENTSQNHQDYSFDNSNMFMNNNYPHF